MGGLPTVLLEAMALRVPVVATDVSGSRELVQQGVTGVLVPPGSPQLLAEAILQVLAQPEWAYLMAEAHQLAMQFTIENIVLQYMQMYHDLGGGRLRYLRAKGEGIQRGQAATCACPLPAEVTQ